MACVILIHTRQFSFRTILQKILAYIPQNIYLCTRKQHPVVIKPPNQLNKKPYEPINFKKISNDS